MPRYIDGEFVLRRKNYEGNDEIKYKGKAPFFTFVVRNRNLLTHKPEKYAPSYIEHSPIRAIFFEGFVSF